MLEKIEERKKIADVLDPDNSIFSNMDYDFEFIDSSQLDVLFIVTHGQRTVAPLLNYYIKDGVISQENLKVIANTKLSYNKNSWDRLKETIKTEYDIIHNFSDQVKEEVDIQSDVSETRQSTTTDTGTKTDTQTDNLTKSETRNLKTTSTNDSTESIQGFNSSSFTNKDKDVSTGNSTDTGTVSIGKTGTQTIETSNNLSTNQDVSNSTDSTTVKGRTMSRIGNIGNITTQQMLREEIELWKWKFINRVLDDTKELCGLSIYL